MELNSEEVISRWLWYRRTTAWPVETIARKTQLSQSTVRRVLRKLERECKVSRDLEMGFHRSNNVYRWDE